MTMRAPAEPFRKLQAWLDSLPMTETKPKPESLLVRIAAGDVSAVSECMDRYGGLVWSVVGKAWKDYSTIEDLVQEIFIDLWKSAERFDPELASESTFVMTITRRRVIDRRRRLGRSPEVEMVEDDTLGEHDEELRQIDLGDDARLAREALSELGEDQRRVILMSVVDGLTHQEIAEETGIPLGTVKSHIRRGLNQTAQRLRDLQGGSP